MHVKNWVMAVAILILTLFVVIYGIDLAYPRVNYEEYCGEIPYRAINTSEECDNFNGKWIEFNSDAPKPSSEGYCDLSYYCRQDYDVARESYSKNVFLISIVLGILIISLGAFLFNLEAVGIGLMAGGVGTLLFGVGNYWRYAGSWLRFVVSFIGLVALIGITYYLNNSRRFGKRKK